VDEHKGMRAGESYEVVEGKGVFSRGRLGAGG
jgi:hypothetical protein